MHSTQTPIPQWQSDLIQQILNGLEAYYCLPEKFQQNKRNIEEALVEQFRILNQQNPDAFFEPPNSKETWEIYLHSMNSTLEKFDPHLHLQYDAKFLQNAVDSEVKVERDGDSAKFNFGEGPPPHELERMNTFREKLNYGFTTTPEEKIEVPDNIGYLKISCLLDPRDGANLDDGKYQLGPNAVKRLNEIMQSFRNKKGIIIDLRDAPEGGSPEMVQYIISFFIEEKNKLINTIENRLTKSTTPYYTLPTPNELFIQAPVIILTDKTTFSAREEIAYDFQQLNKQLQAEGKQAGDRFQIFGEEEIIDNKKFYTVGGAHPEMSFPLLNPETGEINRHIYMRIPYARTVNPYSGTNWEEHGDGGIRPDKVVSKENGLSLAIENLQSQISKKEIIEDTEQKATTAMRRGSLLADRSSDQQSKKPDNLDSNKKFTQ
ncbi:MAG: S41 family peptidase [Gammaproteobacteria bacterium]|nr:S41 family peptidase [Gammaproteobacteria bacterium]